MSETEQFWYAVAAKYGDNRKWSDLSEQQQRIFVQGINCILVVLEGVV